MLRRPPLRSFVAAALATLLGAAGALVPAAVQAPPAVAAMPSQIGIEGHGWGHGRGMGQYGSLGYALAGSSYGAILQHFYSNTTAFNQGNPLVSVRLMGQEGRDLLVTQSGPFQIRNNSTDEKLLLNVGQGALLRVNGTKFEVFTSPASGGCNGPWTKRRVWNGSPVAESRAGTPGNDRNKMLHLCMPGGGLRAYRGSLQLVRSSGAHTVNHARMEEYLRGVVPRESPASWGDLGGGRGMEALKAQSVAARSYASAQNRYSYAKTCDTTMCQVYAGALEDPRTDLAIGATAGQVRRLNGAVASTEFSSSTGGYSAGGTFPAVRDHGDDVVYNPNHTWRTSVSRTSIEARWGTGTLISIDITRRNGLGDYGGRVLTMVLRGSRRTVTISGDDFRIAHGLKSNWFRVLGRPSPTSGIAAYYPDAGYWLVNRAGEVTRFRAPNHGSLAGKRLNAPIVDMASPPSGNGYWLLGQDGGVFAYKVPFHGSTGNIRLAKPVVAMAAHPSGNGYWFVASDGGVFSYGAAKYHGSMGGRHLNKPIVGMASTPNGKGYWLVASDGGIFAFGNARFYGSTGNIRLNEPIVAMAAHHTGRGYWFVARDGGVFAYGAAKFHGSIGGSGAPSPIVDMARTARSGGYWFVAASGKRYAFGTARL